MVLLGLVYAIDLSNRRDLCAQSVDHERYSLMDSYCKYRVRVIFVKDHIARRTYYVLAGCASNDLLIETEDGSYGDYGYRGRRVLFRVLLYLLCVNCLLTRRTTLGLRGCVGILTVVGGSLGVGMGVAREF